MPVALSNAPYLRGCYKNTLREGGDVHAAVHEESAVDRDRELAQLHVPAKVLHKYREGRVAKCYKNTEREGWLSVTKTQRGKGATHCRMKPSASATLL